MWLHNTAYYFVTHPTWLVCYFVVLAVVAGMLPDIDHLLHYYLRWGADGRFLHNPFAIIGFIFVSSGIVILVALVCRHA